jgi:hypothetical protein
VRKYLFLKCFVKLVNVEPPMLPPSGVQLLLAVCRR